MSSNATSNSNSNRNSSILSTVTMASPETPSANDKIESKPETGLAQYESTESSPAPEPRQSIELQRINTYRLQQQQTVGSCQVRPPRDEWLPLGAGKPYPPSLPDPEDYVVEFEGAYDPMHPQNWPMSKRIPLAALLTFSAYVAAYTSAVFPTTSAGVMGDFHFGQEVAALGTTLFVLGFAAGPTIWGPGSELLGRRIPLLVGVLGFSIFTIACATAHDAQTVFITRFFAGLFAASPVSLVPASLSDLFNSVQRGLAIGVYTMAVFIGPFTAPFIGGFTASHLGWRWTLYIPSFFGFLNLTLLTVLGCETYAPTILVEKAAVLRRQTRNWGIHARQDELEIDFRQLVTKNLARPLRMLVTEPIIFLLTLYMSFIYGLAYALLQAYPVVFGEVYGWPAGVNALPFVGLIVGLILGTLFVLSGQRSYIRKLKENNHVPVPEWRLRPCIVGGVCFAGGIFWFGWTGYNAKIHWMVPTVAGLFVGFGMVTIFMQGWNYLLDSYLNFAASAFAANMMVRSTVGAVFPLFATQMFENMGVQWAATLLGCIAALMIPIPIAFRIYGPKIRQKSRVSPTAPRPGAGAGVGAGRA